MTGRILTWRTRALFWGVIPLLLVACAGGNTNEADADGGDGLADEADAGGPEITPPALPQFTPCPSGWREITDPDLPVVMCDPYPESGPAECGDDEAHFPGDPGCTGIGTACPSGDWADELPTDVPVIYVKAGAIPGGDGTRDRPYSTIGEAFAAAPGGSVVALDKAMFQEDVTLPAGVTVWGACVSQTILASSSATSTDPVVRISNPASALRNIQIRGVRFGVIVMGAAASLSCRDVLVTDTTPIGIQVKEHAHLSAERLVISNTKAELTPGYGAVGDALYATSGAHVVVRKAVFIDNENTSVWAWKAETAVELTDVAIIDTRASALDGLRGFAVYVREGAQVVGRRLVAAGSETGGVFAIEPGTELILEDSVVRDTRSCAADASSGVGVGVERGATAELRHVLVERSREAGIFVGGEGGGSLVMSDVVVRDNHGRESDGKVGRGLEANSGATVVGERLAFVRNREVGLLAAEEGTQVNLADLTIEHTLQAACAVGCPDDAAGSGAVAVAGGSFQFQRFGLCENALCGVQLAHGLNAEGVVYELGGVADLHDGEVAFNEVCGVNVGTNGFDLRRLLDNVFFHDNNGMNLDSTALPVPAVGTPIEE